MAEDQTKGQRLNFQKPQLSSLIPGGGGQTQQTQQTQQQDTSGQQATGGIFLPGISNNKELQSNNTLPTVGYAGAIQNGTIKTNVNLPGITSKPTTISGIDPHEAVEGMQRFNEEEEKRVKSEYGKLVKRGVKQLVGNVQKRGNANLSKEGILEKLARIGQVNGADYNAMQQYIDENEAQTNAYNKKVNDAFSQWEKRNMDMDIMKQYEGETITNLLSRGDAKGATYKLIKGLSENITMIPEMVVTMVAPEVGLPLIATDVYIQESQSTYEDLIENGATYEQAQNGATIVGLANASIELLLERFLGGVQRAGASTLRRMFLKNMQKEVVRNVTKKGFMEILGRGILKQGKTSSVEGLEEILQQLVSNAFIKTVNPDKELSEGMVESFDQAFWQSFFFPLGGGSESVISDVQSNREVEKNADLEALDYVMQGEERKAQRMQQAKQNMKDKFLNKEVEVQDQEQQDIDQAEAQIEEDMMNEVLNEEEEDSKYQKSDSPQSVNEDTVSEKSHSGNIRITPENSSEISNSLNEIKKSLNDLKADTFLKAIKDSIAGAEGSNYITNKINGRNYVLRVSDHNANANNAIRHPKRNSSIVIKLMKRGKDGKNMKFKKNNKVDMVEFVYDPANMTPQVMQGVIDGIQNWLQTGEYTDTNYDSTKQSTRKRGDTKYQLKYEEKGYKPGVAGKNEKSISGKEGVNLRSKLNKQTIKQLAEKYGIKVEVIEGMIEILENGKRKGYAYGKYIDQLLTLSEEIKESTAPHELLHAIFDMIDPETKAYLISQVMQSEGWSAKQAEEWLADSFSNFYRTGKIEGAPKSTWGKIKMFFKRVRSFINGLGKWRSQLEEIFTDIIESEGIEDLQGKIDQSKSLNEAKAKMKQRFLEYSKNAQKMQKKSNKIEEKYQKAEDPVEEFRKDTAKYYPNYEYIESDARGLAEEILSNAGVDAEIVDLVFTGSKSRGLGHDTSDYDILIELKGDDLREDTLFDILNDEDWNGGQFDFNPILEDKSGSLKEVVREQGAYMEEKRKIKDALDKEGVKWDKDTADDAGIYVGGNDADAFLELLKNKGHLSLVKDGSPSLNRLIRKVNKARKNNDAKYQIVYHGSPYEFEKFDSSNMGKGEGAQAHGRGHYVAVNKTTGKHYAEMRGNGQWSYKGKTRQEIRDMVGLETPEEKQALRTMARMEEWGWNFAKAKNDQIRDYDEYIDKLKERIENVKKGDHRIYDTVEQAQNELKKAQDELKILKNLSESDFKKTTRNLYEVEIPDPVKADTPTGSNYLEEREKLSKEELTKIADAVDKKLGKIRSLGEIDMDDVEKASKYLGEDKLVEWVKENMKNNPGRTVKDALYEVVRFIPDENGQKKYWMQDIIDLNKKLGVNAYTTSDIREAKNMDGKSLYEDLSRMLGSDKEVSKFLESLGYDGIHYFGGRDGEAYVIFNDDSLKIESHEKYQKMEDNEGRKLSPQQAKYFKDSVARVDEDINNPLVRVYHTTTNRIVPFSEFNPVGTDGYRFRDQVVNYYTDDEDMSGSYANQNYKKYDKTAKLYTRADVDKFIKEINEGDYYNYANKEKLNFEIREVGPEAGVGSETKYAGYQKWDMNQIKKLEKVVKQLTPEEFELFNNVGKRGSVRDYIENDTDIKYWDYSNGRGLSEEAQRLEDLNTKIREKLDDLVEKEGISIYDIYDYKKYKKYPNGVFNGMAYKSEKELIRNIENDVEYKINGPKNYQYDGYVNITNPLIVDAEGRNWNTVRTDSKYVNETKDTWRRLSQADKDRITDVVRKAKEEFEAGKEENEWNRFDYSEENPDLGMVMGEIFPEEFLIELADMEWAGDGSIQKMVDAVLNGMTDNDIITVIASGDAPETTNDIVISTIKSNKAGETNYDGIIIKNVVDYGGKSNKKPAPHNLYVTFASNQFKSIYNENPTDDEDIRYQEAEDQTQSEAFKKRFGDSKVVDYHGNPKIVYHGTPSGEFWIFNKNKASVEGDRGAGFYFTDSDYDANANYVGGGPDFDNKIGRLAEQIEQEEGISYEEAREKAREQLYIGDNQIDAYLKIENPVRVGSNATDIIGEWRDSSVEEYNEEDFDNEDDYYRALDEARANALDDIHRAIWNIGLDYGTDEAIQKVDQRFLENDYGTAQQLKDYLNDGSLETYSEDQGYANNEVARAVLEGLGYDGIMDDSVSEKFKNMGINYGTTHYIVFEPNQIKSATDNRGTFDPNYNDIRYQTVYHGSPNEFDRFDSSHMGEGEGAQAHGWGHYVAVDPKTARTYAEEPFRANEVEIDGKTVTRDEDLWDIPYALRTFYRDVFSTFSLGYYDIQEEGQQVIDRLIKEYEDTVEYYKKLIDDKTLPVGVEDVNLEKLQEDRKRYLKEFEEALEFIRDINPEDIQVRPIKDRRNFYEVEIPDPVKANTPTGSNYIEEQKKITLKQRKDLIKRLRNIKKDDDHFQAGVNFLENKLYAGQFKADDTWKNVYEYFDEGLLYRPREVSEALQAIGYDGIHYDGQRDGECYVIFDDNDLEIKNHEKYQIAEYDYDENGRRTNLKFGEDNSEFDPSIFDRSREDQIDADKENEKSSPFYNAWVRYNAQNYKDDQLTLEEFINEIIKRGDKEQEIYDQKMRDIGEAQNDPKMLDLQLRAVKLMEEEGQVGKKFGKNVSKEVRDRQQAEVEKKREQLVKDIFDWMYPGLRFEDATYDDQKMADQKEAEWEMLGKEDIESKLKYFKKDKNGNREAKDIKVENPDIKLEKILSSGKWEEIFTPVDRVIEWKTPQGQKGRIDRLKEPAKYKRFFEKIYDPKTKTKVEVKDVTKEVRALEKYRADEEAEKARKKKERQEAFAKKQQEEYKKLVRMKAFQKLIDMQWLERYPFLSEDEIKTRYGFTDEEWKKITEQDEIKLPKKRGDRAISDFNKAVDSQVKALIEGLTWQNNMKQREAEKNLGEIGEIDIDVLLGKDEEKGQKEVEEFEKIAKEEKKKTKKEKTKRLEQAREDVTKVEIDKERENSKSEKERIDRLIKSTKTDRTVRGSVKQFTSDILTPVSTKIRNISKKIHMEVMRYFQNKDILTNTRLKEVDPFLKAMGKIRKENPVRFMDIWVALANRNIGYANGLLEEYGVKVPTKLLDTIYDEAEDVGLNINYLGSYYPLSVKAPKSFLEELMKINKGDIASQIEERIRKESQKKGGPLEESEITAIINEVIAGEDKGPDVNTGNKHLKKRNTEIRWTPKMLEYCDDPISTLISYIEGMTQSIERAKFLGKSRSGNVHTLADYVYNAKNGLTPDQQDELMDLLKAVFNDESPNKFIQTWRDLGTLTTLGSPSSTLTQLGDLSFSVYENGWRETLKAVRDLFASRGAFNLVDMGVLNRGEEYTNINSQKNLLQKAIHNVFKLTFFSTFDTFGKSTYIQSTWRKRQKRAKQGEKGDAQFRKDIMKWTDDEFMTDKIINDIKQGRFSQEVALLMYMKLSNIQPLTKAQMPKVYLNNPNGRLFYQFKTFGIKQLDYVLQETKEQTKNFKNLSTIDKFLKIAQVANMVFIMTLLGVGADELKDLTMRRRSNSLILRWLMGEKVGSEQIWEKMADNVLKLFGLSRYTVMQMKSDPVEAITSLFTTLPATNLVNYPFKDIYKAFKDDGSINWRTASSYQLIPLVGKYRYWIFGGGQEKQKEALKKSKKKKKSGGSLL